MRMRLARILGAVGRFLITTGVVMLLFVGYQLWGTGIQYAQAQDRIEDELDSLAEVTPTDEGLESLEALAVQDVVLSAEEADAATAEGEAAAQDGPIAAPDLLARLTDADRSFISALYPDDGDPIGKIFIDKIGLSAGYLEGVGVADLRDGPGHYSNTPMPGQEGNAAIAGHRTTYGAPFHRIDELDPGDMIEVSTLQGNFHYRVTEQTDGDGNPQGHFIVSPGDTQVLDDFGDNRLTLTACHPKYSARQRIIVVAELVDEPEPTLPQPEELAELEAEVAELAGEEPAPGPETPAVIEAVSAEVDDSFGEGLNGDQDAIPPAVSWGLAAIALWLTAGFVGRRWKLITSYAIFLIPTLALLWMSFVHIDQALPSY